VARYRIDPGPPLLVTTFDLRIDGAGAADPGFRNRVGSFPLRQGEILYHPAYEVGKQALVDYAAAAGYLDATYKVSEIRIDEAAYTCDVILHFDTGPRYLFGPVTFNQDFLDPAILRGYVTFKQGDPLDLNKLLEMQTALSGSPYFQRVEVLPREDQAQGLEVPIEADLVPSKPQRWHFGIGYGTDTGPRATAAFELRHINREGHRAQAEAKISEIDKSFTAGYQIPGPFPRTDVISFDAGYAFLNPKTSESRIFKLGSSLSESRGQWRQSVSLGFQREVFTIGLDGG
jgi:translocation and assembly module TamA